MAELTEKPIDEKTWTTIYILVDPCSVIRYVGKTSQSIERRLKAHIRCAIRGERSHKANWIRTLLARGQYPSIVPIQQVEGDGCEEEIAWIKYYRSAGLLLTNTTDGGDGIRSGYKHSGEALANISAAAKLRCADPAFRAASTAALKNKTKTPATLKKMSEAQKGRVFTEEHKQHMRDAARLRASSPEFRVIMQHVWDGHRANYVCSEQTRAKLSATSKGRKHTPEFCERQRQIMLGNVMSAETKEKLSLAGKGRKMSDKEKQTRKNKALGNKYALGNKLSKEAKYKISKNKSKRIFQYDLQNNLIKEWESKGQASEWIKKETGRTSNITTQIKDCILGKQKTCAGYKWKYKN
jgi:hypothetical protein